MFVNNESKYFKAENYTKIFSEYNSERGTNSITLAPLANHLLIYNETHYFKKLFEQNDKFLENITSKSDDMDSGFIKIEKTTSDEGYHLEETTISKRDHLKQMTIAEKDREYKIQLETTKTSKKKK